MKAAQNDLGNLQKVLSIIESSKDESDLFLEWVESKIYGEQTRQIETN